ncbi:hypothetical protein vBVpPvVp04M_00055 [Vibrio phage vB_Vp_PvVp04_M]|nr:hypothetical protein vBVpPvVp04M_00055 [Vibrio phage vB_Vp_PvVp04_M]
MLVVNMEEFRDISGYEGLYQISNFGRVRSVDRLVTYSNGTSRLHKGIIRKPSICEYNMIVLSKNGKLKTKKISRLVASHFIENPHNLRVVNHIDGNKHNDKVENLE